MKRPVLWTNGINLSGLWFDKPRRFQWQDEDEGYWDSSGDFDVRGPGEDTSSYGIISFASKNKAEAEAWTRGAKAVMRQLKEWCG